MSAFVAPSGLAASGMSPWIPRLPLLPTTPKRLARTPLSVVAATPTAVAEQEQAVCVRPVHVFESVLRVKLFLSHFVFSLFFFTYLRVCIMLILCVVCVLFCVVCCLSPPPFPPTRGAPHSSLEVRSCPVLHYGNKRSTPVRYGIVSYSMFR